MTTTTPTASTKTHQSISTPELERSMELFEATYFMRANNVSNVKRPAWYGTPPPYTRLAMGCRCVINGQCTSKPFLFNHYTHFCTSHSPHKTQNNHLLFLFFFNFVLFTLLRTFHILVIFVFNMR